MAIAMPVFASGGGGTLCRRCSDGSSQMSTKPSLKPGTARMAGEDELRSLSVAWRDMHKLKEQKLSVFTESEWSNHGSLRCVDSPSTGNTVDI